MFEHAILKSRYDFSTMQVLDVLSYASLPVESIDGKTGTVTVNGRVGFEAVGNWLILDMQEAFCVKTVNYQREQRITVITVEEAVNIFRCRQFIKPASISFPDMWSRVALSTIGQGPLAEPVFKFPYVSLTKTDGTAAEFHSPLGDEFPMEQHYGWQNLGPNGSVSLADLISFARTGTNYMEFYEQYGSLRRWFCYTDGISDSGVNFVFDKRQDSIHEGESWKFPVVDVNLASAENTLLTEDYTGASSPSMISFRYDGHLFHYVKRTDGTAYPEYMSRYNPSQPTAYDGFCDDEIVDLPISERDTSGGYEVIDMSLPDQAVGIKIPSGSIYLYWRRANQRFSEGYKLSYSITFLSAQRIHYGQGVRLIMDDGEVLSATISAVELNSTDGRYKYTCGGAKTRLSQNARPSVRDGILYL